MIIDLTLFDNYTGDHNDSDDAVALKTALVETAQDIVENYLGYVIEDAEYTYTTTAIYKDYVSLPAPILAITSVTVDGEAYTDLSIDGNYLYFGDVIQNKEISVTFTGGYDVVPSLIKIAVCKIASLLMLETNNRIGVTGASMNDGMSHTYVSYTNYNKHLQILNKYRIVLK